MWYWNSALDDISVVCDLTQVEVLKAHFSLSVCTFLAALLWLAIDAGAVLGCEQRRHRNAPLNPLALSILGRVSECTLVMLSMVVLHFQRISISAVLDISSMLLVFVREGRIGCVNQHGSGPVRSFDRHIISV